MAAKRPSRARKPAESGAEPAPPGRPPSPRRRAPAAADPGEAARDGGGKQPLAGTGADLLKAGLKALGDLRSDAVERHSRVFESLLGAGPALTAKAKAKKPDSSFKLPTFEGLFDERVACSLERIGMTQAMIALKEQLDRIDRRLAQLEHGLEQQQQRKPGRDKAR